jgi:hypothetical protein
VCQGLERNAPIAQLLRALLGMQYRIEWLGDL